MFYTIAAVLASASLVKALPAADPQLLGAGLLDDLKSFTVNQLHAVPKPPAAVGIAKTFAKYGKPVPEHIAAAAAGAQRGSVAANNQPYDEAYLSPVTVGSSALMLDFDTGSSDLWVFSTLQPSSQTSGHSTYPASGTRQSGETWSISYGDGSGASGVVYSDKVVIGGVTATSQAVEAATSVASSFARDTNTDGLVGLAFQSINTCSPRACNTFMSTVGSSLTSNLFSANLKKGTAGKYDFGFIDTSAYSGSLANVSVNTGNGFWEFNAGGYAVGSGSKVSTTIDAIADTGTSLVYLPDSVVSAYYRQVSGAQNSYSAGGYIFPCSATLPNFSVYIAGQKRTIPGSYINYAPNSGSTCFGGIQSSSGIGVNILGDVFLKSQYVVFNMNGPTLGFGQAV